MELEKVYEPQRFEPHWAQWWIESGIYHANNDANADAKADSGKSAEKPAFSIVIPPPNVTGYLHIGHLLDHTVMDVAVRWHRMMGENTLWLPGMDHAGIATQMVVERQLSKEGLSRHKLGREEFERRVWQWKEQYGGRIKHQIEREGASVDWTRERFTMDAGLSRAVRETFVRLWEQKLIYRGEYMVNWCPDCRTAISDVETIHEAQDGHLWHIRYKAVDSDETVEVATTRPETMLGDTALAVHPDDVRYKHLHGKRFILPLVDREIVVIADTMVDPKFGTGVVKITPGHDPNDFEAGRRHNLPIVKVIGEDGRMTAEAGRFASLDRFEARKRVIAALEESGSLVKTEAYTVNISKCDRSKTVIEPLVSMQWFVRMKPLAEKALQAVESGQIKFVPDDRIGVFFHWMRNIRDWCISRQLWWGHRIPAWHCRACAEIIVARETPAVCTKCHSNELERDSDVLDTWFSSGLWPFSTLGWPEKTPDYEAFYPTSLLITGFDILFFWVARMIMLGIWCTGEVPFREVHMHGLVRDSERQKMSKTKGNVIDPLDLIDRYGTDAARLALLISAAPGTDIALKEDRMASARGFANKIWNASRFLFLYKDRAQVNEWQPGSTIDALQPRFLEDQWIVSRLSACIDQVNRALEQHRYHEAGQNLWDFVWRDFCDWYVEAKKPRFADGSGLDENWQIALPVYETTLRLLHPFMPFITEELWQRLVHGTDRKSDQPMSISLANYPRPVTGAIKGNAAEEQFTLVQQIVTASRELRADHSLSPKDTLPALLKLQKAVQPLDTDALQMVASLGKLTLLKDDRGVTGQARTRAAASFELAVYADAPMTNGLATNSAEARVRIERENAGLVKASNSLKSQLSNEVFLSRAPENVQAGMREKLAEYEQQLARNHELLEGLGS